MGADDANEGHQSGECVEHRWLLTGVTFARDGAHEDFKCTRCAAVMVVGPDELAGRV